MRAALIAALALLAATPAMAEYNGFGPGHSGTGGDNVGNEGYDADLAGKLQNDINFQRQLDLWNGVVREWLGGPKNESRSSGNNGAGTASPGAATGGADRGIGMGGRH